MPPQLALAITLVFIGWLFARDRKRGDVCSGALWVPLLWLLILGSRPISVWLSGGEPTEPGDYQEGSPLDRNVFLGLILAGIVALLRRRISWGDLFAKNRWLFVYFAYLGLSVLWADFPLIAFKRWFKDCGNIVMALLILSEVDRARAFRLILVRCAYVLIPLSVVLIKYFPDVGRYYNPFIWTYSYGGVTQDKNMLGATLILCELGLFWNFLELRRKGLVTIVVVLLMVMGLWLFTMAHSSTGLACTVLGIAIVLGMQSPTVRSKVEEFGLSSAFALALVLVAAITFDLTEVVVVDLLGRDMTFTGRTEIWQRVLSADINPLFGTGYYSFWMVKRVDFVALGWMRQLNESHNGYIETYLNDGLVGLGLLSVLLLTSIRRVRNAVLRGTEYDAFVFAFMLILPIYNFTEAAFNRLSPIWVIGLLVMTVCPRFNPAVINGGQHTGDALGDSTDGVSPSCFSEGTVLGSALFQVGLVYRLSAQA